MDRVIIDRSKGPDMPEQDLLLIHGTWGNGDNWGDFKTELEDRGFRVHCPTQRYHGNPKDVDIWSNAQRIAKLSLLDYVADLCALVETMETPPIIVGHSVGGLLAQLVGARVPNRGLILLGTAPAWGFPPNYDPTVLRIWARYLPQMIGSKPMYPVDKRAWDRFICNETPSEIGDPFYDSLCAESGTVYREIALWFVDRKRAAKVDYRAHPSPVVVIAGELDKCTPPRVNKLTVRKYGQRARYVEIPGSDHMMEAGAFLPLTMAAIDLWLNDHQLMPTVVSS
jgi:pimeloyl-ACP methyl ester carboxylesterase